MQWIWQVIRRSGVHFISGIAYIMPIWVLFFWFRTTFLDSIFLPYYVSVVALLPAFIQARELTWRLDRVIVDCVVGWRAWVATIAVSLVLAFLASLLFVITITLVALGIALSPPEGIDITKFFDLGDEEIVESLSRAHSVFIWGIVVSALAALVWIAGRFAPALPATVFEKRFIVMDTWYWTLDYSGRIFAVYGVFLTLWAAAASIYFFNITATDFITTLAFGAHQLAIFLLVSFSVAVHRSIKDEI